MLPDWVSNPGPLTYKSGVLPIAQRGSAWVWTKMTIFSSSHIPICLQYITCCCVVVVLRPR